jgi:UDP-2-acetamido-2,6-beta-L-arabino-hexul-4-ose reductase
MLQGGANSDHQKGPNQVDETTNVGAREMVTLFWSSEIFDPNRPDTYYLAVDS